MTRSLRLRKRATDRPFQSYQIYFLLKENTSLHIGSLGLHAFPAGLYVYTGSATRHLEARIRRHLAPSKRNRWHIDYLLSHAHARVIRTRRSSLEECALNQRTPGQTVVRRLGASDCTRRCESHLKFIGKHRRTPTTVQTRRQLQ